jgi:ATP-dependent DNA helicase RecQ
VGNYLCPRNVVEAIEAAGEPTNWFALAVAVRALAAAPNGVWDDVTDSLLARSDLNYRRQRAQLRPTAGTCERWHCQYVDQCPLYRRLQGIDKHPGIIATNHALVAVWTKQAQEHDLPGKLFGERPTALVLDEAHNLEDSLTSAWADEVSAVSLAVLRAGVYGRNGLLRQIRPLVSAGLVSSESLVVMGQLERDLASAIDELGAAVEAYLHDFGGVSQSTELRPVLVRGRPLYQELIRTAVRLVALLGALQARLINARPSGDDPRTAAARRRVDGLIEDAAERAAVLGLLRELPDAHAFVHRLAGPNPADGGRVAEEWVFERLPIEIGPLYKAYIASSSTSVVLTSATLRVAESFDFIGSRLGLAIDDDGAIVGSAEPDPVSATGLAVDSPFDHDEQSAVVLMSHLPLPVPVSQDEFCEELGADQVGFLSLSGGRTLGLFAARSRMTEVAAVVHEHADALAERGVDLLVQGDDSPGRIQQRFKANPGTTVYGLRSYWEGFDAPGDTLSYLLMEKPPYPHPDDELARARQRVIQERGGDSFMDYVVPLTAISMTQGFGRLIRRETDRGVALIADRRLLQPSAANGVLLDSLPTSTIHYAEDRDDAWRFAISFVTGEEPDLTQALLVSTNRIGDLLASLRLEPGEDPEEKLRLAAKELFGIDDLRPEQLEIMCALLAGRDVVGFLPTGSGKSLTFQLPALLHPDGLPTVVVSPLVALIKDQVDELRSRRGIRVVAGITGRTSGAERTETMRDLADGKVRLLYIAPERLVRDPTLRKSIASQDLGVLVVDEAHCVSSWGHDFRPEFRQITTAVKDFRRSPRLGLTATATREVEADIIATLDLVDPLVIRRPVDRPDLSYWVQPVAKDADRTRELLRIATHMGDQPGIVYASRRALTEELAWVLREAGFSARAYHGGMVPEQREAVQDDYLAGVTQIIVATKAFGMGVNKPDIGWVVHYDLPESLEGYAQEAGRAARSPDLHGLCVLFFTKQDLARRRRQVGRSGPAEDIRRAQDMLVMLDDYPARGRDRLIDAEELAERLKMESDELNVMVAWLERAGALERLQDCSWRARVSAGHREPQDQAERGHFVRLVKQQLQCKVGTSRLVNLADAAEAAGMGADALEDQLIDWSLRRLVTFQTTQRRWRLRRTGSLDPKRIASVVDAWHRLEERRLQDMIRYATGTGCRRSAILSAFGDEGSPCGTGVDPCDIHAGTAPPWHAVPITDVIDPEELVDVELVTLQAVRWATSFTRGSYGEASLKAAILGRESLGEGRPLGRGLLSCPQFGALRYLRSAEKRLDDGIARLAAHQLIGRAAVTNGDRSYTTLTLTDAGRARLEGRP